MSTSQFGMDSMRSTGAKLYRQAPDAGPWPTDIGRKASPHELRELQELTLDIIGLAFDLAGIVDPSPICDGASALLSLSRGRWLDAAISGAGAIIPYAGDLAKAGKLPRYLRSLQQAIELAERTGQAACLLPGVRQIEKALTWFPVGANKLLDEVRDLCAGFTHRYGKRTAGVALRNISASFRFRGPYTTVQGNKRYSVRFASGRLGVPGRVVTHEISSGTRKAISRGTGDDAGHLIGKQFGAPSDGRNLSRQNWRQNQGGGTWHELEDEWAAKLGSGIGIRVKVREFTPAGSQRPLWREVEWEETSPQGNVTFHKSPKFLNTHTADSPHRTGSRTQGNIEASVDMPQLDNVHSLNEFKSRQKPSSPWSE